MWCRSEHAGVVVNEAREWLGRGTPFVNPSWHKGARAEVRGNRKRSFPIVPFAAVTHTRQASKQATKASNEGQEQCYTEDPPC